MKHKYDEFKLEHCIFGLISLLGDLYSQYYEYSYRLTFKGALKNYAQEFKDPWNTPINDDEFFAGIDDAAVNHSSMMAQKMLDIHSALVNEYREKHGSLNPPLPDYELDRYRPSFVHLGQKISYGRCLFYYELFFEGTLQTFYYYACALTLRSYKIPVLILKHIDYTDQNTLWLLDTETREVALLKSLIVSLMDDGKLLSKILKEKGRLDVRF